MQCSIIYFRTGCANVNRLLRCGDTRPAPETLNAALVLTHSGTPGKTLANVRALPGGDT